MKKSILAVSMALVLSIAAIPESAASVKAGGACKKAGQTNTVSGKKFKCVKKGGKLVWGKGVAVKARPTARATSAASVAPTAPAMGATPTQTNSAEASKSAEPVAAGYTMEKVKANSSAASCWSAINGNVYDLTKWINSHPGGSGAIRSLCGTDGTSAYNGMHGNQGKPQSRLAGYLLGPLSK